MRTCADTGEKCHSSEVLGVHDRAPQFVPSGALAQCLGPGVRGSPMLNNKQKHGTTLTTERVEGVSSCRAISVRYVRPDARFLLTPFIPGRPLRLMLHLGLPTARSVSHYAAEPVYHRTELVPSLRRTRLETPHNRFFVKGKHCHDETEARR